MSFCNPEDHRSWDIVKATQYGIVARCKALIEAGYDVRTHDSDNITLLHWAAINNRLELARYYISLGAVVDVLGGDLMATPLHWAIREGHLGMVVLLIQAGADPCLRDAEGCAAIHVAVQCAHTPIVAYLIAKGTDPDLHDANGKTPLMWATWRTFSVDPTRTLLSMYASVNMKDMVQHNTPLHWACMSQNTNVIMLLVQAGADLDAKNDKGETPLDIARIKKNVWITSRLQMIRRERGLDTQTNFFQTLVSNKTFRQRTTFVVTFFSMFCVGFILELSTPSWLSKMVLCIFCYLLVHGISAFLITQNETMFILPLAISIATKFWVYCTAFFYYWPYIYAPIGVICFFLFSTGMWYFFYKSIKTNPGIITMAEDQKKGAIVHLAETDGLKLGNICSSCLIIKPLRSKHCSVTNRCVAKFDHYCPWVFNTIGAENHPYFIGYLVCLLGILSWHIYAAFQFWQYGTPVSTDLVGFERIWSIMKYSPWVVWIFLNCVFHSTWVCVLLVCQLYQIIWLGVTTNERMNAGRYHHFHTSQHGNLETSPFNRGVVANFADFFQIELCGMLKPLKIDWKSKMEFLPEYKNVTIRKSHDHI
uniref:Palmitoyltransferase n=1 Tax=Ciona intestinalis TaxID=7719 RepID=Q1RPU7_CIOIN|nr:zinc finger protein [Ciona intestinalis]BAE93338.1 zinc finger protein [Ciona intestinalis]|eukprot:NP_001071933.1 zinc finger protein [Ciona intestinalis]